MVIRCVIALARFHVDFGGIERVGNVTDSVVFAQRYHSRSCRVQSDRLLFHQWQSQKELVPESFEMRREKGTFIGR